jgi:hypothetical protein
MEPAGAGQPAGPAGINSVARSPSASYKAEVHLGDRQIKRYARRARGELPESIRQANPELLD